MNRHEITHIKEKVDTFLLNNKERYDVISSFADQVLDITDDSYPSVIKFIEDHSKYFFDNKSSSVSFLWNIFQCGMRNWTKLEIIYDIIVHFLPQVKSNDITDEDILGLSQGEVVYLNFLFSKKILSIESIIQESHNSIVTFIYFLPEIEKYDNEYAKKREKTIMYLISEAENPEALKKLYRLVKSDPEKHVINRTKCYNISSLHKSIRDDDIDGFQSLLSLNNFNINHRFEFDYYERLLSVDNEPSLIQVAAIYGALKIFKFLWMQQNIILDKNLISYAISGRNTQIIHICETKCSIEESLKYSIMIGDQNLIDYCIDNFSDRIQLNVNGYELTEHNHKLNDALKKFDSETFGLVDKRYHILGISYLNLILSYMNYNMIIPNLYRILYIVENFEDNTSPFTKNTDCLILNAFADFPLFKFLYSYKSPYFSFAVDSASRISPFDISCQKGVFYVTNYVISLMSYDELAIVFANLSVISHFASLVLDYVIKLMSSNDEKDKAKVKLFRFTPEIMNYFLLATQYFDEDLITKFVKIDDMFYSMDSLFNFILEIDKIASNKMIISLFDKIIEFLPNDLLNCFVSIFAKYGYHEASDFIMKKRKK